MLVPWPLDYADVTLLARHPAIRTTSIDAWFDNLTSRNPGTRPVLAGRSSERRFSVNALNLGSVTVATGRCAPYGLEVPPDARLRVHLPFSGTTLIRAGGGETAIAATVPGMFLPRTELRSLFPEGVSSIMLSVDKDALRPVLQDFGAGDDVDRLLDAVALRGDLPELPALRREVLRICQLHDEEPDAILDMLRFRRGLEDTILLRVASGLLAGRGAPEAASRTHPAALRRCLDYLAQHSAHAVSMQAMARDAGTSLRQAQFLFRRELGTSPAAYLRTLRLNRARDLLQGGKADSVTDVALSCGFTHLGEFSGRYRAAFGESPSETLRRTRRRG